MAARSEIAITELVAYNAGLAVVADAVDLTNHHFLDVNSIPDGRVLITFHGSTASMTATFKAGDFSDASLGDLVVTVGATAIVSIVVESSRFKDTDGYILIDVAGATADGTIEAVKLP